MNNKIIVCIMIFVGGNMMDFSKVINERKSARSFEDKNVSLAQINKIIKSASLAPSAKNRQPWKFCVLSTTQKNEIANMLLEWDLKNRKEKSSAKGTAHQILDADKMIMVYKDTYKSKFKSMYYGKPDYISVGCALENMSLEAINQGLGSCILCDTLYVEEEINKFLNVTGYEQICGFIVGYPIYEGPLKPKKNISDLII